MILADWEIKREIKQQNLVISPYDKTLVNPASLDCRLGGNFSIFDPFSLNPNIDPLDKSSINMVQTFGNVFLLEPNSMVLASLLENIELPNNIAAKVMGKSSLGRLGLDSSCSIAGWIDPGFAGVLTIEIVNHSNKNIKLTKGMKINQLVFYWTNPVEKTYKDTGRYYKQKPGQGSLGV